MKIITDPPALKVKLDGVTVGRSPMKLQIGAGAHEISIEGDKASGSFPVDGGSVPGKLCFEASGRKVKQGACP